ncbi:TolC family protein [Aquiflexum lacus]|uniref:TolC family protein n=1 Tax=Aquiflexum lacus TaxID=2483805 RepID=UPI001894A605|nr:TolC family protein [Aquiflexum lacus]
MNKKLILLISSLLVVNTSKGQTNLDRYIKEGFENNQSIQQQQFYLDKSIYALKEAKSLFLPNVSLLADYFQADGGRTIDFPTGDLFNPVYNSLNQITGSNNFPLLENQTILLNPDNFYDIKFRATQPILNLEIEFNRRIKRNQVTIQQVEIDLYKRELAKEIKLGYFKYLQSVEAIKIYDIALRLAEENKRINESLYNNDKVNRTVVLRAENEIIRFKALRESAQQTSNNAKAYFNFLLNKDLKSPISIDSIYQAEAVDYSEVEGISGREELLKLQVSEKINENLIGLSKSFIVPKMNAFIDLGSQGFDWQFDNKTSYYFLGVSMQWNLFASGRNQHRIKQAQIDQKIINSQTDYVSLQLQLQLTNAINDYKAALFNYQSAVFAYNTSTKFYSDILRLYKEGQSLFVELLDAQNQLVQSELQVNISLYDTYIKSAEIERANASFNINN